MGFCSQTTCSQKTPLSEFFNVEVVVLSSYEEIEEQFKEQVMAATVRCEEIANEKFTSFLADEAWCQLEEAVQHGIVPGFGKKLSLILDKCLSGYDMEAIYFDDSVRTAKQRQLESKLLQLTHPAYRSKLGHLRLKTLDDFKEDFEKALQRGEGFSVAVRGCTRSFMPIFDAGCEDAAIEQAKWDSSKVHDNLRRDIDAHVASVRVENLSKLAVLY